MKALAHRTSAKAPRQAQRRGTTRQENSRGVSLVEALVAMAVMGFGMVGLVGMQSGLHGNADLAKQRAEATRIAQERIEERKAFSSVADAPGRASFNSVASSVLPETVAGVSASFTLTEAVPAQINPLQKTLVVDVQWEDRTATPQTVRLVTALAAVAPDLAGSLALPRNDSPASMPRGRNRAIPTDARPDLENPGRSRWRPDPEASPGVTWFFDNATGLIVENCTAANTCSTAVSQFLAGFIRFSTLGNPTGTGESPPGEPPTGLSLGVALAQTAPVTTRLPACFTRAMDATALSYACLVPASTTTLPLVVAPWSGRSTVSGLTALLVDFPQTNSDRYRVCRYTSLRSNTAVAPTDLRNEDHPRAYADVTGPLTNQNFLVIRAGNGDGTTGTAYDCPDSVDSTAVTGRTWRHQPDT